MRGLGLGVLVSPPRGSCTPVMRVNSQELRLSGTSGGCCSTPEVKTSCTHVMQGVRDMRTFRTLFCGLHQPVSHKRLYSHFNRLESIALQAIGRR